MVSTSLQYALSTGIETTLRDLYEIFELVRTRGRQLGLLVVILPDSREYDGKEVTFCHMHLPFLCFSDESHVMCHRESGRGM